MPFRVVFPGFALTMTPELTKEIDMNNMAALLEAVGMEIGSSRHPSRLDVLQIINTSTLPLFWKSPLFCKLYPFSSFSVGCGMNREKVICYQLEFRK